MPPALTPALALEYLRALSTDLRAGVVVTADTGEHLAGPPELAGPARLLLAAAAGRPGDLLRIDLPSGRVLAATSERHAIVLAYGPLVLQGLAAFDLRAVLADLGAAPAAPPDTPAAGSQAGLAPLAAGFLAAAARVPARA